MRLLSLLLNQRLRLDDRALFGKRVKRREHQAIRPRFGDDITQGRDGQAVVGLKVVQDAAFAGVGEDLVVNVKENLLAQPLDLKTGLINELITTRNASRVLAAKVIAKEASLLRQRLLRVGHFGQQDVLVLEGDNMAGARDPDAQLIPFLLDLSHGEDIEQLRVQGPPVELKDKVGHPGPDNE